MSDARDRRKRNVRVAAAALSGLLALCEAGAARAEEAAAASGTLSLNTDGAGASGTAQGAPAADQAPAEAPMDPRVKNPANYEFAFVSVAAYQTWSLSGSVLYFGMGGGFGPALYRIGKTNKRDFGWDPDLEIAFANAFLRVKITQYVDLDVGPRIGLGASLFDVPDAPQSSFTYGGYADLFFGSPTVKFGPRFEYNRIAHSDFFENGWRITPLLVRVTH